MRLQRPPSIRLSECISGYPQWFVAWAGDKTQSFSHRFFRPHGERLVSLILQASSDRHEPAEPQPKFKLNSALLTHEKIFKWTQQWQAFKWYKSTSHPWHRQPEVTEAKHPGGYSAKSRRAWTSSISAEILLWCVSDWEHRLLIHILVHKQEDLFFIEIIPIFGCWNYIAFSQWSLNYKLHYSLQGKEAKAVVVLLSLPVLRPLAQQQFLLQPRINSL